MPPFVSLQGKPMTTASTQDTYENCPQMKLLKIRLGHEVETDKKAHRLDVFVRK